MCLTVCMCVMRLMETNMYMCDVSQSMYVCDVCDAETVCMWCVFEYVHVWCVSEYVCGWCVWCRHSMHVCDVCQSMYACDVSSMYVCHVSDVAQCVSCVWCSTTLISYTSRDPFTCNTSHLFPTQSSNPSHDSAIRHMTDITPATQVCGCVCKQ